MGLTETCINYFGQTSPDKFGYLNADGSKKLSKESAIPFENCVDWIAENKDSQMGKECLATGMRQVA